MKSKKLLLSLLLLFALICPQFVQVMAEETKAAEEINLSDDSSDFVILSDAVPDAILEIRYYSSYNFVGRRIDGYEEPLALLTKEAASALKEVSDELVEKGYRLKIFDAYRPQRAVTDFMNWALDPDDTLMKEYFYPELDKEVLFPQGYIAEHSGHSRGSTVDLTLFDMTTQKEVDMGGTFDYFGELSHPDYKDITEEQYNNRMILREAMLGHGFKPLEEEWWHFTLEDEPYPDTYFTFPVSSDSLAAEASEEDLGEKGYTLEQVVILSRHNLRAPLSSNGSVPQELTPHQWTDWSANSSELTINGGIQETSMGQYFRKWLNEEGLIEENSVPKEGEVRFNARDKQRCRATARYFASGLLPLADINVEYPAEANGPEDFMSPVLKFYSEDYARDAVKQVADMGGEEGFAGLSDETRDAIRLIMDTADVEDSEIYKSGKYGDLLTDGSGYMMEADKEPDVTGAIKTASQVGDALVLQYYEEPDELKAAFGHELTEEDWKTIGGFMTRYLELKHGAPMVAVNITHPLIEELESELKNEDRKLSFFCAHDCTVLGALTALGAEPYSLPDSIETRTPIGVKLLFERWRDEDGKAWYRVDLVYRSAEQIRDQAVLTPDNPPMRYDLKFEGVETNEDGLIPEEELFGMFDRTEAKYEEMKEKYTK